MGQGFFKPLSTKVIEETDCQQYLEDLLTALHQPTSQSGTPLSLHVIQESQPNAAILSMGQSSKIIKPQTYQALALFVKNRDRAYLSGIRLGHLFAS